MLPVREMGKIVFGGCEGNLLARWRVAGRDEIGGGVVIEGGVRHRSNDAEAMRLFCQKREMFRDADTGHASVDRLEFTAYFDGGGRLHVPDIELTWTTVQQEQHARLRRFASVPSIRSKEPG